MWTWIIFHKFLDIVVWILAWTIVTYWAYVTNRRWGVFSCLCFLLSPYLALIILLIILATGTGEIEYRNSKEVSAYDNKKEEDFVPLHLKGFTEESRKEELLSNIPSFSERFHREREDD